MHPIQEDHRRGNRWKKGMSGISKERVGHTIHELLHMKKFPRDERRVF